MTEQNIVNSSNGNAYYKICKIVLRSAKYGNEINAGTINATRNAPDLQGFKKCRNVSLRISYGESVPSNLDCLIMACECRGFIPKKQKFNTNFRIAATSDPNSVMLLKKTDAVGMHFPVYNLLEYFEEIHLEYLENYEFY